MADYVQNINSLASVTSLSQLKLDSEGRLARRSFLETLGHKIKDAFRALSSEGKAAITARNGALLTAMQRAVDESTHHDVCIVREVSAKLEKALERLQSHVNQKAYFGQIESSITGDPRFTSLPATSRAALAQALENMKAPNVGARPSEWKTCATALKWAFFGEQPPELRLARGMERFAESLREGFLNPSQQAQIKDGFHQLTFKDFRRGAITRVGDIATPRSMEDDYYRDALDTLLGYEHRDLMPFVSTVIAQNGLGTLAMQLPRDSGHNIYRNLSLGLTGKNQQITDVTLRREGHELVVDARYEDGFKTSGVEGKAFSQLSTVTMHIDLAAAPERHVVNGREVLIPQFRLENVGTAFSTAGL